MGARAAKYSMFYPSLYRNFQITFPSPLGSVQYLSVYRVWLSKNSDHEKKNELCNHKLIWCPEANFGTKFQVLKLEDQIRNSLLVVENHGERSTCTNQASKRQNNQQNPNFGTNVFFCKMMWTASQILILSIIICSIRKT